MIIDTNRRDLSPLSMWSWIQSWIYMYGKKSFEDGIPAYSFDCKWRFHMWGGRKYYAKSKKKSNSQNSLFSFLTTMYTQAHTSYYLVVTCICMVKIIHTYTILSIFTSHNNIWHTHTQVTKCPIAFERIYLQIQFLCYSSIYFFPSKIIFIVL